MSASLLLAGAFGQSNPGDDALVAAFAAALPEHRLLVPAPGPLPRHDNVVPMPATGVAVGNALRRVDAVVLAGGTVFKVLDPSAGRPPLSLLARAATLARAAHLTGRPVAALGVGAGRLDRPAARRLARRLVSHLDLLVLRDEGSADALAGAGVPSPVRVGADPVWTLFPAPILDARSERTPRPVPAGAPVHVALSHLAGVDPAALAGALALALDRGHPVVLEPWQQGSSPLDAALAAAVVGCLPPEADVTVATDRIDIGGAVDRYRSAAAVVGLRFHALVAAAVAGCRFLAVDHEPKLAGIAQRTGQRCVPAHAPVGILRRSLALALDGPPPAPAAVRTEAARAHAGFELLRLLLSGGRGIDTQHLDGLELVGGGRSW